jgi:ABC-type spermidine/putrescine transport system permease subunit II
VTVAESVTWIKVEHPSFDLAGVLISSLQITGGLLIVALVLGTLFGLTLLWRRRRQGSTLDPVSLRLEARS